MPKIAKEHSARSEKWVELHVESCRAGEKNDCWVKALAVVVGIPYEQAHAQLAAAGRRKGRGLLNHTGRQAIISRGFELVHVNIAERQKLYSRAKTGGYVYKSITPHHVTLYPEAWAQGTYLFFTDRHVVGVKDGMVHDWTRGRKLKVHSVWQVVPAGQK